MGSPRAQVTNKRIDGQGFHCEIQVVDSDTGEVLERMDYGHVLDYKEVSNELLQSRIDALKAELLQRVQNRAAIDLGAIN